MSSNTLIYQDSNVRIYIGHLEYTYRTSWYKQNKIIEFDSPVESVYVCDPFYIIGQRNRCVVFHPAADDIVDRRSYGIHDVYQMAGTAKDPFSGIFIVENAMVSGWYDIWLQKLGDVKDYIHSNRISTTNNLDELLKGPPKDANIIMTKCIQVFWSTRPIKRSNELADIIIRTVGY